MNMCVCQFICTSIIVVFLKQIWIWFRFPLSISESVLGIPIKLTGDFGHFVSKFCAALFTWTNTVALRLFYPRLIYIKIFFLMYFIIYGKEIIRRIVSYCLSSRKVIEINKNKAKKKQIIFHTKVNCEPLLINGTLMKLKYFLYLAFF